ncbi:hypothetical protein J2S17_000083 [Cytobacillus purgationiresistens]|uniref:Uncharacterized protein n=1 Tax=Cytobacillus purgationiresistens TaxID=863449 RepID=A0ABU0AAD8_9BACI|nr:hypothetical protein [Cytobacillus purgationiresistens]
MKVRKKKKSNFIKETMIEIRDFVLIEMIWNLVVRSIGLIWRMIIFILRMIGRLFLNSP